MNRNGLDTDQSICSAVLFVWKSPEDKNNYFDKLLEARKVFCCKENCVLGVVWVSQTAMLRLNLFVGDLIWGFKCVDCFLSSSWKWRWDVMLWFPGDAECGSKVFDLCLMSPVSDSFRESDGQLDYHLKSICGCGNQLARCSMRAPCKNLTSIWKEASRGHACRT